MKRQNSSMLVSTIFMIALMAGLALSQWRDAEDDPWSYAEWEIAAPFLCLQTQTMCEYYDRCYFPPEQCDGMDDCGDWSDEDGCRPLPDFPSFKCPEKECPYSGNKCIRKRQICDGERDCWDTSDEVKCAFEFDNQWFG